MHSFYESDDDVSLLSGFTDVEYSLVSTRTKMINKVACKEYLFFTLFHIVIIPSVFYFTMTLQLKTFTQPTLVSDLAALPVTSIMSLGLNNEAKGLRLKTPIVFNLSIK